MLLIATFYSMIARHPHQQCLPPATSHQARIKGCFRCNCEAYFWRWSWPLQRICSRANKICYLCDQPIGGISTPITCLAFQLIHTSVPSLKSKYHEQCAWFKSTRSGVLLQADGNMDVPAQNLLSMLHMLLCWSHHPLIPHLEDVLRIFPYYQDLNAIWHGIPLFDSELVSSKPGVSHAVNLLRIGKSGTKALANEPRGGEMPGIDVKRVIGVSVAIEVSMSMKRTLICLGLSMMTISPWETQSYVPLCLCLPQTNYSLLGLGYGSYASSECVRTSAIQTQGQGKNTRTGWAQCILAQSILTSIQLCRFSIKCQDWWNLHQDSIFAKHQDSHVGSGSRS